MVKLFSEKLIEQFCEALEDFKFWDSSCYTDCIKDEHGCQYDGETVQLNWVVSCYQDGKVLLTINKRNYWFESDEEANAEMIELFKQEVIAMGRF